MMQASPQAADNGDGRRSMAEAEVVHLAVMVEAQVGIRPDVTIMGPVIGSHVGPGAVAVIWKSAQERQD